MKSMDKPMIKALLLMSAMFCLIFGFGSVLTQAGERANLSKTVFYVA